MIRQRQPSHEAVHPSGTAAGAAADQVEPPARLGWVHHMFFLDEATAREARRRATAAGWHQEWLPVVASFSRHGSQGVARDVVVSHGEVADARAFFDSVCTSVGGSYTGWDLRRIPGHALS